MVGEAFGVGFGGVMGVDDEAGDAVLDEVIHGVGDHGAACYGEHGFGAVIGEGAQAGAEASA